MSCFFLLSTILTCLQYKCINILYSLCFHVETIPLYITVLWLYHGYSVVIDVYVWACTPIIDACYIGWAVTWLRKVENIVLRMTSRLHNMIITINNSPPCNKTSNEPCVYILSTWACLRLPPTQKEAEATPALATAYEASLAASGDCLSFAVGEGCARGIPSQATFTAILRKDAKAGKWQRSRHFLSNYPTGNVYICEFISLTTSKPKPDAHITL